MKTWIDNTGLHAVGNCIFGEASTDFDVQGLLQLATIIVFSDQIVLNGFEDKGIRAKSKQVRSEILSFGLRPEALQIQDVPETKYAEACCKTAKYLASELPYSFSSNEDELLGLEPTSLPRGAMERMVGFVRLATDGCSAEKIEEVKSSALQISAAVGAIDYMMVSSENLRNSIAALLNVSKSWNDRDSYHLSARMRFHLNQTLARSYNSFYVPAVGRAQLIDRQAEHVIVLLEKYMNEFVDEIRPSPLGLPCVSSYLLSRAAGDPKAIIDIALELRAKATDLRRILDDLDREGRTRISYRKELADLIWQLRCSLGLEQGPTFIGAMDVQFVLGLPPVSLSLSGRKLLEWARYRRAKADVAVITDIVKDAAIFNAGNVEYVRLKSACMSPNI